MKNVLGRAAGALLFLVGSLAAQAPQGDAKKTKADKAAKPYTPPPIFASATPMEFTLEAPFNKLKRNRGDQVPYYVATVSYKGDSGEVRIPLRVRARGIWRRKNCDIPPLRLNFSKDSTKKTEFRHLNRVRLVLPCRNNDDFEQYVLQEFQLYRVQRLITPLTLNVRLVKVKLIDPEKKDTIWNRHAFLIEEESDFGSRVGGKLVDIKGASGDDLDPYESAVFGVFEYFVGNTDFSVAALHNVALLYRDTTYIPIAYDYDWAGAVNTRYARPDSRLQIRSVTDRLMRGYCTTPQNYEKVFGLFREKKDSIYALYHDSLAAPLKEGVVKNTLKYFDDFYEVINDKRLAERFIIKACLASQA
jgi:hypothetical protein